MTNAVISAVKAMAEKEGQPLIKGGVPLFEWCPNASVEDFLEGDVESADEHENFTEDNFDPTEPDTDEGAEANDNPGDEAPGHDSPNTPWSPTQTKIRVPIGTTSGATEADPTETDLITKWMIP